MEKHISEVKLSLERERIIEIKERALKIQQEWNYPNEAFIEASGALMVCNELLELTESEGKEDSEMLFHECPQCNSRCNCTTQPCSCCEPKSEPTEYFKKVYIKTEADLPKEDGFYFVNLKTDNPSKVIDYNTLVYYKHRDKNMWLESVDWYLQKIDIKDERDKN